jgi:hypothetical protein
MLKSFGASLAIVIAASGTAFALPQVPHPTSQQPIIAVANGCGPGAYRTIAGDCRPNQPVGRRGFAPPPCPRGYARDPDPARPICYPVY